MKKEPRVFALLHVTFPEMSIVARVVYLVLRRLLDRRYLGSLTGARTAGELSALATQGSIRPKVLYRGHGSSREAQDILWQTLNLEKYSRRCDICDYLTL